MDLDIELDTELRERRARVLALFFEVMDHAAQLPALHAALSEEIVRSELARRTLGSRNPARSSWKRHDRLIRTIGDGLAWHLLDRHAIRVLGRAHSNPASIAGQGDDFSLVLETANRLAVGGIAGVVCDTTNVLRTGDIAVASDGELRAIIECKNRPSSATRTARDERQQRRGELTSQYLSVNDILVQSEDYDRGPFPPLRGKAIPELRLTTISAYLDPKSNLLSIGQVLEAALHEGSAGAKLDDGSFVYASDCSEAPDPELLPSLLPPKANDENPPLGVGFISDIIEDPDPLYMSPAAWPFTLEIVGAILEGDLSVTHGIPYNYLLGSDDLVAGWRISEVVPPNAVLKATDDMGREVELSERFALESMYEFTDLSSVRRAALFVASQSSGLEADGYFKPAAPSSIPYFQCDSTGALLRVH
jgi:hypothetical protein